MDHFDQVLTSTMVSAKYSAGIHAAIRIGKQTLDWYYSLTDASEVYRIAMGKYCFATLPLMLLNRLVVLDPRYKLGYFQRMKWEDEWVQTARKLTEEAFSDYEKLAVQLGVEEILDDDDILMVPASFPVGNLGSDGLIFYAG